MLRPEQMCILKLCGQSGMAVYKFHLLLIQLNVLRRETILLLLIIKHLKNIYTAVNIQV